MAPRVQPLRPKVRPALRRDPPVEELLEFDHSVAVSVDFRKTNAALIARHVRSEAIHQTHEFPELHQSVVIVVEVIKVLT